MGNKNDSYDRKLIYDVVIAGGGTSGVVSAIAAARMGVKTLLIEKSCNLGGQLTSGLPLCGTRSAVGEWLIGGITTELINKCKEIDSLTTKCIWDWRVMWIYMIDTELLKIVIMDSIEQAKVSLLVNTMIYDVLTKGGVLKTLVATDGTNKYLIDAKQFIDATGDGLVAAKAGVPFVHNKYNGNGEVQPVSMIFRMNNINLKEFLEFIRDNPENIICGESPIINKTRAECVYEIYKQGYPTAGLDARGPILSSAIKSGEMFPTIGVYWNLVSKRRNEIALNTTRVANIDSTISEQLSLTLPELFNQINMCVKFFNNRIPGFEKANLCNISQLIGIRENRRIIGEYILNKSDVLSRRKFKDVIARSGHHVDIMKKIDIHGSGTNQVRIPIPEGGAYDIPFRCLIPKDIENLLVVGRSISSDREAFSSLRQMSTCMMMGQAAAVASVLSIKHNKTPRAIPFEIIKNELEKQGFYDVSKNE